MSDVLVAASGLNKSYRAGEATVHALSDVSLTIRRGEYVAIMGRSGSGKSTLMSILGLLDRSDSGRYALNGRDVARLGEDDRAGTRRKEIGFVFQSSVLLPRSTALENVELPLAYAGAGTSDRRRKAMAALDRVGLAHRSRHTPFQLSGGEQQRVAIARALVNDPRLLLADEPTGALDSTTADSILTLFDDLNRDGRTMVVVTHAPEVARRARRCVTISDGRISSDDIRREHPAERVSVGA